jgi:DNA-binding LacI/PurR family transcriptional regulator
MTTHDLTRIAAEAITSVRTAQRVYEGLGSDYSRRRVTEAAQRLGLEPPPPPVRRAA